MPPLSAWYRGRLAIKQFLDVYLFAGPAQGRFRLVATRANGCPAFAVYQLDENRVYRPVTLQVLTIVHGLVAQMDDFLSQDEKLFARFNLPLIV